MKKNKWNSMIIILIFACSLAVFFPGILAAQSCEKAFVQCINNPFWLNPPGTVYCLNGYFFCLKYIQ